MQFASLQVSVAPSQATQLAGSQSAKDGDQQQRMPLRIALRCVQQAADLCRGGKVTTGLQSSLALIGLHRNTRANVRISVGLEQRHKRSQHLAGEGTRQLFKKLVAECLQQCPASTLQVSCSRQYAPR